MSEKEFRSYQGKWESRSNVKTMLETFIRNGYIISHSHEVLADRAIWKYTFKSKAYYKLWKARVAVNQMFKSQSHLQAGFTYQKRTYFA